LPVGELSNFVDVEPKARTLVVPSDRFPHEVLDTETERMTVVPREAGSCGESIRCDRIQGAGCGKEHHEQQQR